ncbi:MAG: hypothetical protein BWY67_00129 [Bacteroidetes bacterium ADurb.Bin397]|jgi:hypothetical protein|nr:MAG: hypothetical protein BWY67_00129 [Bacteroidetes bacterium ADurb.Bin397]
MMLSADSESALSQTIEYLSELRLELNQLLKSFSILEPIEYQVPRHSLFSAPKFFRKDELFLSLHRLNHFVYFSHN